MLKLLRPRPDKVSDRLGDPDETRRWLAAMHRGSEHAAAAEIARALVDALAAMDGFTTARLDALLLVDARAVALLAGLLDAYAQGGHHQREVSQQIVGSVNALTQSFFAYYDALMEALQKAPAGRASRLQLYTLVTRRLAHLRDDATLSALRYEKWIPMRWEKTHRLYRLAMQQLLHDVHAPGAGSPETATIVSSAEAEYIRILLTHQLNQGQLESCDIRLALAWLGQWVDRLTISTTPASGNAFALYPDGRAGLAPPPGTAHPSLLWLDVSPLLTRIGKEIAVARGRVDDGSADPVEEARQIALLQQLALLWRGPVLGTRRREARAEIRETVRLEFGLASIVDAMQPRAPEAEPEMEEIELRAVGDEAEPEHKTWVVYDVSVSGCRVRGTLHPGAEVAPGTLVALHLSITHVWMVGIVRRILRLVADEVDLGVQVLATSLRVLTLKEDAPMTATGLPHHGHARVASALLLVPGAGRERPEQSVIVTSRDFAPERTYLCTTGRHNYQVALEKPIEKTADYVWATLRATRLTDQPDPGATR